MRLLLSILLLISVQSVAESCRVPWSVLEGIALGNNYYFSTTGNNNLGACTYKNGVQRVTAKANQANRCRLDFVPTKNGKSLHKNWYVEKISKSGDTGTFSRNQKTGGFSYELTALPERTPKQTRFVYLYLTKKKFGGQSVDPDCQNKEWMEAFAQ